MMYALLIMFVSIIIESFPVSSSGHIVLLENILLKMGVAGSIFIYADVFDYASHIFTLFVLAVFFFDRWFFLLKHFFRAVPIIKRIFVLGFLADSTTLLFYAFFYFIPVDNRFISLGFLITTIALYSLRYCNNQKQSVWNSKNALIIGAAQGIALIPGVSRLGVTLVVMRLMGFSWKKAFEISFLIAVPLCVVGSAIGFKKMYIFGFLNLFDGFAVGGLAFATFFAFIGLKFVVFLAKKENLWIFSGYTATLVFVSFIF